MSDQYTPPGANIPRQINTPPGAQPYRPDVRVDVSTPPPNSGGFSSGILVAIVFLVVAIIAAALYSNTDVFGRTSAPAPSSVTIENNAAPADAPAAPATGDAPAVEPVPVAPVDPAAPAQPAAPANP